tara:strand:- start:50 stop:1780 length:1731 start_codon:yes stop_codon:yes gene_type:complete
MAKTRKQRIKNNSRAKTIKNNKQLVNVRENLDGGAFTGRSYREGVYDMWYEDLQKNDEFNIIRGFLRKTCLFFLRGTYVQVVGNSPTLLSKISSKLSTVQSIYPFSNYSDNWKSGNIENVHKALRKAGDSPGIQSNIKNNKALYFHSGNPLSRTGQSNEVDDFLYMIQSVVGMSNSIENMTIAKYKDDLGFEGMNRFRAYGVLGVTEKLSQKWTGSNRDSEYFKKFRELAFLSEESKKSDRFNKYNFLDENNILEYIIYLLILSYPQGVEKMRLREDNKPETLKDIITKLISENVLYYQRDFKDVEEAFKKPKISIDGVINNIKPIIPPGGLQGKGQQEMNITEKELWYRKSRLYKSKNRVGEFVTQKRMTFHSATDPLTPEASSDILFWKTGFAHALTELAQRLLFTKEDINALITRGVPDVSLRNNKSEDKNEIEGKFLERKKICSVTSLILLRYYYASEQHKATASGKPFIGAGAEEMMSNFKESPDVWSQGNQLPKIILMMRLFRFVCLQDPGDASAGSTYSSKTGTKNTYKVSETFVGKRFDTSTIRMNNRINEAAAQIFVNRDININKKL